MEDLSYMDPKVRNMIKGSIRKAFKFSEIHKQVLTSAISVQLGPKGGKRYDCALCGSVYDLNSVEVDHINPVVSVSTEAKEMTLEGYYKSIFTEDLSNLQVLCKPCHALKTKAEWAERKQNRTAKRQSEKKVKVKKGKSK
jgi:5-methylcytosine-specific restriction endonuclease McrA